MHPSFIAILGNWPGVGEWEEARMGADGGLGTWVEVALLQKVFCGPALAKYALLLARLVLQIKSNGPIVVIKGSQGSECGSWLAKTLKQTKLLCSV